MDCRRPREKLTGRGTRPPPPFVPRPGTLPPWRRPRGGTRGTRELYEQAGQTVFGEGPADAAIVLIGEQPGDMEDRQGKPFIR